MSRPTWGAGRPNALTIALAALSNGDSRLLADDVLGDGVDAALRQQIAVAAEGIPLFIEETMAMLVDEGLLVKSGSDEWVATGAPADIRVPATVQALLAARLDQLSPDLRSVIDAASVVGKSFSLDV
ncbi:MAG: guanylate cyclase, partial [Candidatus Nanopelagicales bacterium]